MNPKKFLNIFKRIKNPSTTKSAVGSAGLGDAVFSDHSAYTYAKETYKENVFAFGCIDRISKAVSSVMWDLYQEKLDGEKEKITNHPSRKVLTRPNPSESFHFLMYKATAYLLITGNSYFKKISPDTGINSKFARELETLRPDRMSVVVSKETRQITGFEWKEGFTTIFYPVNPVTGQSEVMQVKLFDPLNDVYGMGPSTPAAKEIDSSNDATEWNKSLLQNKGQPGMLYFFEDKMADPHFKRMKQQLHDEYSGPQNAGKSMILEGARDAKPFGLTPAEFDFIESNRELARRISLAYGVPPMLMGIPGDNTYSNYKEARQAFWEDTIIPHLNHFKGELNNWLFGEEDIFMDYLLDDIPALAPRRQILWDNAQSADFLTINQKLGMVGFEGIGPTGDVVMVPMNLIPLELAVDPPDPVDPKPVEDNDDNLDEDEDKAFKDLLAEGYTEKEACAFLGLPFEDEYV